jgi:putative transferase (TIGR04331 family)
LKQDIPRFLITTSDETTWKFDRPVIFLGEWCRLHSRKHIWEKMDAIVAEPYGIDNKVRNLNKKYTKKIENILICHICREFNLLHKKKYSEKYWKILLGHWLRRYIDVIVNRVKTLKACFDKYNISGVSIDGSLNNLLVTKYSYGAESLFNDNKWNIWITNKIIIYFDLIKLENHYGNEYVDKYINKYDVIEPHLKINIKRVINNLLKLINEKFTNDTDALILNTYLPKIYELKLLWALRQVPCIQENPLFITAKDADPKLRAEIQNNIKNEIKNIPLEIEEEFILILLLEIIPICYLEGFKELEEYAKNLKWPKKPRFIFTSNSYDYCEAFKIWVAEKVEEGCKYIIGQHGNNYGTNLYLGVNTLEEEVSDIFITWGFSNNSSHRPAYIFTTAGNRIKWSYNPKGNLLLVEYPQYSRITTWDSSQEYKKYFEDQEVFFKKIKLEIRKSSVVRLHPTNRTTLEGSKEFQWKKISNEIIIDHGNETFKDQIAKSRIVIFTYDSTGILEAISQNIPFLAYWQNGLNDITNEALPYYKLLIEIEILHLNPFSAAAKLNEIWENVDKWWSQKKIQNAISEYSNKYAKVEMKPINVLIDIMKQQIK